MLLISEYVYSLFIHASGICPSLQIVAQENNSLNSKCKSNEATCQTFVWRFHTKNLNWAY